MNSVNSIVFDVGNVLNEWNPIDLVSEHFSDYLQPEFSAAEFTELWMNAHWAAYDLGEIDTEAVAHAMAPVLRCDASPLQAFIEKIPHVLPPLHTSIDALAKLFDARDDGSAIRVFYLSNMPMEFATVLERRFAWYSRFDGGIFSGRERLAKPDPDIYAALESRYALEPSRTLFFDDSPANVAAAQARGWRAVQVRAPDDVVAGLRHENIEPFGQHFPQ